MRYANDNPIADTTYAVIIIQIAWGICLCWVYAVLWDNENERQPRANVPWEAMAYADKS